ncbi:UV-endonuclease UvdE [Xylaria sp. CBS 124048]|nr:UV-endonuclease UvdE [Xylaria sp. CBS 124048]
MAPKRKRSGISLASAEVANDEQSPSAASLNIDETERGEAVRRSSRLVDKSNQGLQNPSKLVYEKVKRQSWESQGTEVVLSSLKEMEDQLRDVVKRQKMAVEESRIRASEPDEDAAAPVLRHAQELPSTLSDKKTGVDRAVETREKRSRRKTGPAAVNGNVKSSKVQEENAEAPPADETIEAVKQEGARPPPVNSDYLPLPWKGRLGYACLNTYLRNSTPSVFSSRTCRIASIVENRHPLQDPSQPAHPTKNRPDKTQPADIERGQKYVEALGLANARDIVKMLWWNDKYGIKFMRLSSEMFPFASHEQHGYKLAPFASEVLAEAGRVAGELGHRLTTHPGQFTQLGSPRDEVVKGAVRDLEYHEELLSLLRLPEQQDKDAVMIVHMGGVFGDKEATLDRFRENYSKLPDKIKSRLVLENDDVSWTVHDLLPICEELNIPLVLDYHHHNIMFDENMVREGTKDIIDLYPRIKATWDRKGITQKMHYSEPCPEAVTPRQRRKHRPRVTTLPPCPDAMDLMIEAKDKEQAVFDLMRTYRLPGWDKFNDVIPYEREDENRPLPKTPKPKKRKKGPKKGEETEDKAEEVKIPPEIPEAELGMGGPNNRVYWPVGMEDWLRPKKREAKGKQKGDEEFDDGDRAKASE